jgi:hypothetical protein
MAPELVPPTLIFDAFWTAAFGRERLKSMDGVPCPEGSWLEAVEGS